MAGDDPKTKPKSNDTYNMAMTRLKNALAAGEISQAEYDAKVAQLKKSQAGSGTQALQG